MDTGESCILRPSELVTQVQLSNQAGTHTYSLNDIACNQAFTAALFKKGITEHLETDENVLLSPNFYV